MYPRGKSVHTRRSQPTRKRVGVAVRRPKQSAVEGLIKLCKGGRTGQTVQTFPRGSNELNFGYHVRAVRRSSSTPPILVSRTTSRFPHETLSAMHVPEPRTSHGHMHALVSALYYPHTPQLRSTRYILPHAERDLPSPNSPRARALLKYRSYNFLLEDPAKPNLFSS